MVGNKHITKQDYLKRINRVIDYIHANLDEDISNETLAEISCFSVYHWHRIYKGITGETMNATIRRLRLHRAASQLITTSKEIKHIAKDAHYTDTNSFIRSFKNAYGIPPASYRKNGKHIHQPIQAQKETHMNHNVEIKQLDELTIAAMDHKGDYMQIGGTFEKAFAYAGQNGLLNETTRSFGIYYDDPSEVAIDELRSQAGFTVTNDFSDTDDIKKTTILGGKYGVLTHRGPYANLEGIYEWLYSAWIADSGEEPRDQPCIEEYVNDPRTTPESELETIIYIPLK